MGLDGLRSRLEDWLGSPFSTVSTVCAGLCTIWGLFEIFQYVQSGWGTTGGAVFLVILLGIISAPVIFQQLILNIPRRLLLPVEERFIYLSALRTLHYRDSGICEVENRHQYLFFREPRADDLADTLFGTELDLAQAHYNSPDSLSVDGIPSQGKVSKIFWQPRGEAIKVGIPYEHTYCCKVPIAEAMESTFYAVGAPVYTTNVTVVVNSDVPISKAVAFKDSPWLSFKTDKDVIDAARENRRRRAPMPERLSDRSIQWSIAPLRRGEMFYVVIFFASTRREGGLEAKKTPNTAAQADACGTA